MWIKNCLWIRARLPLLAGGDSLGIDRRVVERHLLRCPGCRRRLEALQSSQETLQTVSALDPSTSLIHTDNPGKEVEAASLWPALALQIRESRRPRVRAAWSFESRWAWTWPALGLVSGLLIALALIGKGPKDVLVVGGDLTESAGNSLREFLNQRPAPIRLIKDEVAEAEDEARRRKLQRRPTQFSRHDMPPIQDPSISAE